jgi:hypothetical protein
VRPDISDVFVMVFDQSDGSHLPPLRAPPIKDMSAPNEWYPNRANNYKDPKTLAYGITVLVLLLVASLIFFDAGRNRQRKSNIFTYLHLPGGWHAIYGPRSSPCSSPCTDTKLVPISCFLAEGLCQSDID